MGVLLDATKTKVLATEAQPPEKPMTEGSLNVDVGMSAFHVRLPRGSLPNIN